MTEVSPLHPLKTLFSIIVIELGIVIDVKPLHSEKARFPILVTELGIVTEVRLLHSMYLLLVDYQYYML